MIFLQFPYYALSIPSRNLFLTMMMMMMMMVNLVFAGPTGLSLKLIHRDSPESPLYRPGNLTELQVMERAFQQSKHREQHLTSWMKSSTWVSRNNNTNSKSLDIARPPVSLAEGLIYLVQIGIGSFPNRGRLDPIFYYLFMDTASDLLWLQCNGTNTVTFRQDEYLFDGRKSLTYHALPAYSPHPFCRKYGYLNEGGFCGYNVEYADGAGTSGILAIEKLTLNANYGLEVIDNFVFRCGLRQNEPSFGKNQNGSNPVAGILGLGGGGESFTGQLGAHVQNKFEYCLKPWYDLNPVETTSLRFGTDTKIVVGGQGVQTTSIIPTRGDTIYYVTMEGISVANERVIYPDPNVFNSRPDGTGGSMFDTGTPVTQLSQQVYVPLKRHLISFFYRHHKIEPTSPHSDFELCFDRPPDFGDYPSITFHYTGADFVIEPRASFYETDTVFCLIINRSKLINSYSVMLGALQQVNHRILHDLVNKKISWASETCSILG